MKKGKLCIWIGIAVALAMFCVLFFVCTICFFYENKLEIASIFATLTGIPLAIILALGSYILKKVHGKSWVERCLYDEHFVDREREYEKLTKLIQNKFVRIIYINGKLGMGKTSFMKMSCDRINYVHKKKWKSYAAFYYNNNHTQSVTRALSNKYYGNPDASVTDISKLLSASTFQKSIILFIDNIHEIDLLECTEFAKAFINCNKNNYVVIAVDSNENEFHIRPEEFGENEIMLLANSYNVKLAEIERQEITELSNGYPVYARYSIEAYNKGIAIADYRNFEVYLEDLICSLNELEKASLSLIVCLSQLIQDSIEAKVIYAIDNQITRPIIKQLATYSLINLWKDIICIDHLISLKCMDFLSKYKNESYYKIYVYYKELPNTSYIALLAALKSNFKYDSFLIKQLLHNQYKNNNFYILIDIGELEFNEQVNPYLREDKECWIYLRYYYLKSLLELGLYDEARRIIDKYDRRFNLLNANTDIEFLYQYLLVDLDHLTNHMKDAVLFSHALLTKATTIEQRVKCQYLYAHCLRHIGEDLNQAFSIFSTLANATDYNDDKIRIRSIYSAASIKMFQGDVNYNFESSFATIEQILCNDEKNEVWKPYVIRHKAIYEYKIRNNFEGAEQILQEAIRILEVTPLRIKYDIYFELGEIYRIHGHSLDNYNKSLSFYLEAEKFAARVQDYNLQSSSQLGIMLLSIKYGHAIDMNILRSIIAKANQINLNINYNYAIYVKHVITNESIPKELLTYWKNLQYSELVLFSSKDKFEKYDIKLTVM